MADHDHDHSHSHDHDHSHDHSHDHGFGGDEPSALNASIIVADAGPAKKKLSIEVPAESIANRIGENFESLQQEAAIPGFRRGRAPMRLLEKRFGKDVRKEVRNQIVGEAYTGAIEEHELRVLGEPDVRHLDELELPESGPLSFEIEIEVVPEVTLPELKGIKVEKPVFETTDAQVESEVTRYGEMYGQFKPVEKTEHNDYITANIEVRAADGDDKGEVLEEITGQQMLVPGEQRKFKGVVAGIVIEDLGKSLKGKTNNDVVTVTAEAPERHENEKLRGRKVEIDVRISGIERMHPLSAEELAEAMGMESVDELREQIKTSLDQRGEAKQQQAMSQQVAEKLLESVDLELPERVSAQQAGRILQKKATQLMYQGVSQEDIEQQLAELRAASEEEAQRELKLLFVLDKVARDLEVDVTEEEVNGRIYQIAMQRQQRPDKVRDELIRANQIDQLFVQIREEKAIAKILEDADVKEVKAEEGEDKPAAKKTTKKKTTKKKTTSKKKDSDD